MSDSNDDLSYPSLHHSPSQHPTSDHLQTSEKIYIRGLATIAGWIFVIWGGGLAALALYHAFWGEPEANIYSLKPWQFVTQEQWLRWSGFELTYGMCCLTLGWICFKIARYLPVWIERPQSR